MFIRAIADKVIRSLDRFLPGESDDVRIVFTAHSLPVATTGRRSVLVIPIGFVADHVLLRAFVGGADASKVGIGHGHGD